MCEEIEELARPAGLKNNNKNNEARDKGKKHLRVGFIAMSDKKTEIALRLAEEISIPFCTGNWCQKGGEVREGKQ